MDEGDGDEAAMRKHGSGTKKFDSPVKKTGATTGLNDP